MPLQFDSKRSVTVTCGASGTGKTSFSIRYILNRENVTARFFFDWRHEYSERLNLPLAGTGPALDSALQAGWVVYDPRHCFGGRTEDAFKFFCDWVYQVSAELPGRKIVVIDELQRFCSAHSVPSELALIVETGRSHGIELMVNAQRPNALNETVTGQVTEVVAFGTPAPNSLQWLERNAGLDPAEVSRLPPLHFISRNVDSWGLLRGSVRL